MRVKELPQLRDPNEEEEEEEEEEAAEDQGIVRCAREKMGNYAFYSPSLIFSLNRDRFWANGGLKRPTAPEHSFAYIKKTIERAFGRKLDESFDNFEEKPVAYGSIAHEVHGAGQQVKPIIVAVKWWRLDESVQQFAGFIMSQVDLAREAAPFVDPAVLVETYEQDECVDDLEGDDRIQSALAHIVTHALLKMLPDLRIAARLYSIRTYQIIFLRLLQRYQRYSREARLCKFELEIAREAAPFVDPAVLVETYEQEECVDDLEGDDRIYAWMLLVTHALLKMLLDLIMQRKNFILECFSIHRPLQLLETVRRHRVNVDGNVCTVMVTTLVLEGWQRKLDPRIDGDLNFPDNYAPFTYLV
ncbi:unnamed protein product [Prunus armeniaca]